MTKNRDVEIVKYSFTNQLKLISNNPLIKFLFNVNIKYFWEWAYYSH